MKALLNKEGWTAVLTQIVAVLAWALGNFLPPEYQEIVPYILVAIEAIGTILILIFVRETVREMKRLKSDCNC